MIHNIIQHGGGYCGLTGAVHFALKGVNVVIYDPDQATVDSINNGQPRAGEYLSYIDEDVAKLVKERLLSATTDYNSIKYEPIHLLAVPTEKGNTPDMTIVKGCIEKLSHTLPHGGTVIVESTLQPGTIDSLESMTLWQFEYGEGNLHLAVAPRMDWFGDKEKNVTNLPRIVGGLDEKSTKKANEILSIICKEVYPCTYKEAEYAKCGQNYAYYAQIMAMHEWAMNDDSVDFNKVLELISLHWRLPNLYLGPGTSGRCVSMGAKYVKEAIGAKKYLSLLRSTLETDTEWRHLVGDCLSRKVSEWGVDDKLLVMGIAYRANFSDFGNSAGLDIAKYLKDFQWNVYINDPILPADKLQTACGLSFSELTSEFDAILLTTGHDAYRYFPSDETLWKQGQVVLDACGLWEMYREQFKTYGVEYSRVGEKGWMKK